MGILIEKYFPSIENLSSYLKKIIFDNFFYHEIIEHSIDTVEIKKRCKYLLSNKVCQNIDGLLWENIWNKTVIELRMDFNDNFIFL